MRHRSLLILTTTVTVGALTLSACGSRDDKGGSGDSGEKTTVTIGLDAPLTGDLSALGQGIKNSSDLAVKTANKNEEVKGVTFKLEPLDDQAQAGTGQQNATKLVGNQDVYGVVGPLNSNVGQSMQKVFGNANLVQVSPANTAPQLSQGPDWQSGKKKRLFDTYFRTSTTDAVQGPYAAQYLYNERKFKKAYVIDDKKTYGAGLAATFSDEFKKLGGKVVGSDHINPEDRDFSAVATKVAKSKADFVYLGMEYPAGAPLSAQIKKAGGTLPTVGGDALYSPEYIKLHKKKSEGDMATSVGAPLETLDTAKRFIKNYKSEGYKAFYDAYGGYSYDSTWAIIQAVKAVVEKNDGKLPEGDDGRKQVTEAMKNVKFSGVTGDVAFDQYGDTTNKQLSVYEVKGGKHKPVQTGPFQGS
ncbi:MULTISPECIES: branched-chain amino acid ABC transporter substrate-binding protein [unclassified Streptomyces]|uniref:branched-chain amino acid ABC transporter substrate-binding protein n=1 Tax=unclassified Streptomyces TaxID=2593676 RepID=UPI002DDBB210|nr:MULTISPECIES: branched-chain amino acid ABC transporter substrate-binding protein [unclassified Streptomyces]WSA95563.1 branched-chain amino acid ABC transporter substrate-binding protein [Streptomyces sp. NBC_01795]WSB79977.1 branched-chain amino acid ABC transporter substrate-binding protein [Streptomyces sp. NBC_01775]WSS11815.1 branched-chain amino acid ABC transporter substrate-binding protein [Streptomyces sp. NBC_01186]WSS40528.1 branched-chain amino acid ABC transporter substrate-bin